VKCTSDKKVGSACVPTNINIGYGAPFDQMGIDYVQNIKNRFK
jgi:hypothetical protein